MIYTLAIIIIWMIIDNKYIDHPIYVSVTNSIITIIGWSILLIGPIAALLTIYL